MIFAKAGRRTGASVGLAAALAIVTGCTSGVGAGDASSTSTTRPVSTPAPGTGSLSPPSEIGSSIPPATNQSYGTTPASFGTPSVPPLSSSGDALRIVVAGAGTSETPVTGVACTGSQVSARVGNGMLTLNPTAGTLHLQDVVPVNTMDFSGTAGRSGSVITFAGVGTGTSVALRVTCA
jgi:hypothetical protein